MPDTERDAVEQAPGEDAGPILRLEHIHKSFGDVKVLDDISLALRPGEFFTLLGSSGCGKTTTLRIVAGLETADEGRVYLEGADITDLPPNKRDLNTVFQSYALFPSMNVMQNVSYGLKIRHVPKDQIREKVARALALVQLDGLGNRLPDELSGGQRQRAAIARAIVLEPKVLLLDEPLGALDLKLRKSMQIELKRMQRELGITFVYVTHDQEEALSMSDRIGVMRGGRFEQVGTPEEIYQAPRTRYVADFIGDTNLFPARVERALGDGIYELALSLGVGEDRDQVQGLARARALDGASWQPGDAVAVSVRPEAISYPKGSDAPEGDPFSATVVSSQFLGSHYRSVIRLDGGREIHATNSHVDRNVYAGARVSVGWDASDAVIVGDGR